MKGCANASYTGRPKFELIISCFLGLWDLTFSYPAVFRMRGSRQNKRRLMVFTHQNWAVKATQRVRLSISTGTTSGGPHGTLNKAIVRIDAKIECGIRSLRLMRYSLQCPAT